MTVRPNTRKKSARSSGGLLFKRFAFRRQASLCDEQARFRSAAVLEGIDAGKALSPDATDVFYSSPETACAKDRMRLSKTENGMLLGFEKREDLVVEKLMVLRLASC